MDLDRALSRCPFLHNVCEREGRGFALSIAVNPLVSVPKEGAPRRPILEEQEDFASTFRLFHGASGVLPLALSTKNSMTSSSGCPNVPVQSSAPSVHSTFHPPSPPSPAKPFLNSQHVVPSLQDDEGVVQQHVPTRVWSSPLAGAPLATMSLGMPDFGELFRKLQQARQPPKPSVRKPPATRPDVKPSATSNTTHGPAHISTPLSGPAPISGPPPAPNPASLSGTCPLRAWLGPAAGFVFNKAGGLQCPTPIIQARAALAATKPVKLLRPQTLPIKLIAVGAMAVAANVPCGMWREHTQKFSAQWFLAVHASIPFIAMLRKAVIMPKLAIICTIAAAIAGQAIGAKLEREAMRRQAQASPQPLRLPTVVEGEEMQKQQGTSPQSNAVILATQRPAAGALSTAGRRLKIKTRSAAVVAGAAPSRVQSVMNAAADAASLTSWHGADIDSMCEWRMDQAGGTSSLQMLRLPCAQACAKGSPHLTLTAPVACK